MFGRPAAAAERERSLHLNSSRPAARQAKNRGRMGASRVSAGEPSSRKLPSVGGGRERTLVPIETHTPAVVASSSTAGRSFRPQTADSARNSPHASTDPVNESAGSRRRGAPPPLFSGRSRGNRRRSDRGSRERALRNCRLGRASRRTRGCQCELFLGAEHLAAAPDCFAALSSPAALDSAPGR